MKRASTSVLLLSLLLASCAGGDDPAKIVGDAGDEGGADAVVVETSADVSAEAPKEDAAPTDDGGMPPCPPDTGGSPRLVIVHPEEGRNLTEADNLWVDYVPGRPFEVAFRACVVDDPGKSIEEVTFQAAYAFTGYQIAKVSEHASGRWADAHVYVPVGASGHTIPAAVQATAKGATTALWTGTSTLK